MAYPAVFGPEERVELIEGEILVKPPMSPARATTIIKTARVLDDLFRPACSAFQQANFVIDKYSEPEPDVLLVRGGPDDYYDDHPGVADALLVVEVSDVVLEFNQGRKAAMYARAGVADYWMVNLPERTVEVRRWPQGDEYQGLEVYAEGKSVALLAAPGRWVRVSDLLPRRRA